ncbi:hypothetical protein OG785_03775 [Streptomyces sp. NBC_00006]|uniref:hypothetical protein n=1 Tax=Streptomyces sp. NBC_00006 TaxID=2975619 RepID=UPI00225AC21D|nr:hypothetical protein [Streptomyces sp. NBC_00006]MCX5529682.1 hypothetical protein [Streptomyces sp. NBC_00006]
MAVAHDAPFAPNHLPDGYVRPPSGMVVKRTVPAVPAVPVRTGAPASADGGALRNIDGPNEVCGTSKLQKTSGMGKTTLVMTVSKAVSAELSSEAKVDAEVVSASLGFKVTETTTVEDQTRFEVPAEKFGVIEVYPLYDQYTFNVYDGGRNRGSGWAMKPTGVCFHQYTE